DDLFFSGEERPETLLYTGTEEREEITSLLILWLSSISSDRLLRIILFLLSLLLITPYIFMAAYVALILSVSLMFV
ncbi:hypothetical protein Q4R24_15550, partial [Morganella morganii]